MTMLLMLLLSAGVAWAETPASAAGLSAAGPASAVGLSEAGPAALPTELDVKFAVGRILLEREKTVQVNGAEQTWQSPICYVVSYQLAAKLKEEGFDPYLNLNHNHMNIGINVQDKDGKPMELVIDPTYRQFFIIDRYDNRRMTLMFDFTDMPKVLIVPRKDLKKVLESFPLDPRWKFDNSAFGFDYYFDTVSKLPVMPTEKEMRGLINIARDGAKAINVTQYK